VKAEHGGNYSAASDRHQRSNQRTQIPPTSKKRLGIPSRRWTTKFEGESMSIELGDTVRDRITNFEGVVTGRCAYLSGCNQMLVVPPAKEGAYRDGQWFDEQRLVAVPNVDRIVLENGATPGFDTPAPKR
jgi:hypothetical protein